MSFKTKGPILTTAAQSTGLNPSNDGNQGGTGTNNYFPDYTSAAVFSQQTPSGNSAPTNGYTTNTVLANVPAGSFIEDITIFIDAVVAQGGSATIPIQLAGVTIANLQFTALTAGTVGVYKFGSSITPVSGQTGLLFNSNGVGSTPTNKQLTIGSLPLAAGNTIFGSVRLTVRNPSGSIGAEDPYNLVNSFTSN